jgi:cyclic pyranopterin phosphate synthase
MNDKHLYSLVDGRVRTRSLESHIVDHCNLRCAACCSLSPHLPKWEVDPAALAEELRLARPALAPTWLKLVGGEPLLHSRLMECIAVAKAADIAEIVSLTTNGFLLPRQPDEFWEALDAMTISLYPQPALPRGTIDHIMARAEQFKVRLNWKKQDSFVQMDRDEPCADEAENAAIWDKCWLRHRCHMIREGHFYACTRPAHFGSFFDQDPRGDGVLLHEGATLAEEIKTYLERPQPLEACAHCLGGNAPELPHRQLKAGEGRALVAR